MVRPIGYNRKRHADLEGERLGIGGGCLRVFAKRDAQAAAAAAKAAIVTAPATSS
jgi:hypothetical protein